MAELKQRYIEDILPKLKQELAISNNLAVPRLDKIVVNCGIGQAQSDKGRLEDAQRDLAQITGQKPAVRKSRKSISNFKLREGMEVGLKVTLRGQRMYDFFERLVMLAIPRVRDFRGLPAKSFDGRGNYNFGLTEQTVFPEIDINKVKYQQGMNITICTSAKTDEHARRLLEELGFPFAKPQDKNNPQAA